MSSEHNNNMVELLTSELQSSRKVAIRKKLEELSAQVQAKDEAGLLAFMDALDDSKSNELSAKDLWSHHSDLSRTIYFDLVRLRMYTVLRRLNQSCHPQSTAHSSDLMMVLVALDANDEQYALSMLDSSNKHIISVDQDQYSHIPQKQITENLLLAILMRACEQQCESVALRVYQLLCSFTPNVSGRVFHTMESALISDPDWISGQSLTRKHTVSKSLLIENDWLFARMCQLGFVPIIQLMIEELQQLIPVSYQDVETLFSDSDDAENTFGVLLQQGHEDLCYKLLDLLQTMRQQLRQTGEDLDSDLLTTIFNCIAGSEDVKLLEYMLQGFPIEDEAQVLQVYRSSIKVVKNVLHQYFDLQNGQFLLAKYGATKALELWK